MEVQLSHSQEPVEVEGFRVRLHGKEYMMKQVADGIQVTEITNYDIMVRPQTANTIVIVTRTKN
jgi:hypothetical protein